MLKVFNVNVNNDFSSCMVKAISMFLDRGIRSWGNTVCPMPKALLRGQKQRILTSLNDLTLLQVYQSIITGQHP